MHNALMLILIRREILGRYRGSILGIFWALLTPLLMLAVYTFVFGTILQAKWTSSSGDPSTTGQFAVILFCGLMVFQLFSEVINSSSTLVIANSNLVKKTVFPLSILVPVTLGTALFHFLVSLSIMFVFLILVFGTIPLTALLLPVVIFPFCVLILGIGWIIASLGVYLRDISQFLGIVTTALLFLSPIFYPASKLTGWISFVLLANPVALPVKQMRQILIWGEIPDFTSLAIYSLIAAVICLFGYWWFSRTSAGFSDVL